MAGIFGSLGDAISAFGNSAADSAEAQGFTQEANTYNKAASQITGASKTLLQEIPLEKQAGALYGEAAGIERSNAQVENASTKIQEAQEQRQIYMSTSSAKAAAGGNGLATSGDISYILASSGQQGALTKQLTGEQGSINSNAYLAAAKGFEEQKVGTGIAIVNTKVQSQSMKAQATAYQGQAQAALAEGQALQDQSTASAAAGGLDIIGGIASLFGF